MRKVTEHEKHFHVTGHDGSPGGFKVAKAGLSENGIKQLRKMAEGGDVAPDADTVAADGGAGEDAKTVAGSPPKPPRPGMEEHANHFMAHTPRGSFKIAKHGLGSHVVKEFSKQAKKYMADGGDVPADDTSSPAYLDPAVTGQDPGAGVNVPPPGTPGGTMVDPRSGQPIPGTEMPESQAQGNLGAPGGGSDRGDNVGIFDGKAQKSDQKLPEPAADANANAPAAPGAGMPGLPQFVSPKLQSENEGMRSARAGIDAASQRDADAGSALAAERARVADQRMQWEKDYTDKFNEDKAKIDAEGADLRKQVADGKIDPNHYWHEKGTGGMVLGAIGILLSGYGQGRSAAAGINTGNSALGVIKDAIDRDIDSQKANLETKKSLLQDNYRRSGDLRLALAETRQHYNNLALGMLDKASANHDSEAVQARAAMGKALGMQEDAKGALNIANINATNHANTQNQNRMMAFNSQMAAAKAAAGKPGVDKPISDRVGAMLAGGENMGRTLDMMDSRPSTSRPKGGETPGALAGAGQVASALTGGGYRGGSNWNDMVRTIVNEKSKISKGGTPDKEEVAGFLGEAPGGNATVAQKQAWIDTQRAWMKETKKGLNTFYKGQGHGSYLPFPDAELSDAPKGDK